MAEGEDTQRNFPEWSMMFKSVSTCELAEFGSYVNSKYKGFLSNYNNNAITSMLKTFADANRISDNY
jgi:hypothetical protein